MTLYRIVHNQTMDVLARVTLKQSRPRQIFTLACRCGPRLQSNSIYKVVEPLAMRLSMLMADKGAPLEDVQKIMVPRTTRLMTWSTAQLTRSHDRPTKTLLAPPASSEQAGFHEQKLDNQGVLIETLEKFAEQKIISSYSKTEALSCLLATMRDTTCR